MWPPAKHAGTSSGAAAQCCLLHLDRRLAEVWSCSFMAACRYVHIGESHRGYLGTGSVPWEPFWRGLAEMGYDGPLTFESFSSAVASKSLSQTLCVWRDLYASRRYCSASALIWH